MSLSKVTVSKQPGETRLVSMDFSNKMADDEVIVTIDDVAQSLTDGGVTTDLTITGEVISVSGQIAQFLVAGGIIPTRPDIKETSYKITVTVTTDADQVLENDGLLLVKED